MLTDLGSMEQEVTAEEEDFTWLFKEGWNETIEMIIEDDMFNGEDIYTLLAGGVDNVDMIYLIKW